MAVNKVCNTCQEPIHQREIIYSSKFKEKKYSKEFTSFWEQCGWCFGEWQLELKEFKHNKRKWWKWGLITNTILSLLAGLWGWSESSEKKSGVWTWETAWKALKKEGLWWFVGSLLGFFILFLIVKEVFLTSPDRYKIRVRPFESQSKEK